MTVQEEIKHCEEKAKEKYAEGMLCHANPNDDLLDGCIQCAKEHEQLAEWLKELEQYRALGTVEELKEAREKQVAKKPIYNDGYYCPICNERVDDDGRGYEQPYCMECGQALKWGEEDD